MVRSGSKTKFVDPNTASLSEVYAQGLLDTISQDAQAEQIADELERLVVLLDSIPQSKPLLTQAMLTKFQREQVVRKVFFGRVSEPIESFIVTLLNRGRMELFWPAARSFRKLLNLRQGCLEVEIITAVELSDEAIGELRSEISRIAERKIIMEHKVDPAILGGVKLCVGDRIYDASIQAALNNFQKQFQMRLASEPIAKYEDKDGL